MAVLTILGTGFLASKFARIAVALGILVFFWAVVFPPVELPAATETTLQQLVDYITPFGKMIPLATMFQVITAVLVVEGGLLMFRIFNWLWELD